MNDDVRPEGMNPDDLRDLEALLGELEVDDLDLVSPPPEVWTGIDRRLNDNDRAEASPATVRPITDARRRGAVVWSLAAAAAIVLVVAGAVAVIANRGSNGEVVSAAPLAFDPDEFDPRGSAASAQAELVDHGDRYSIRLTGTSFPELSDDDLELWLIEIDSNGNPIDVAPVSLIDRDGDRAYDVPAGLDPTTHFVVDISIEPRDGDASHSGQSILRGALQPA